MLLKEVCEFRNGKAHEQYVDPDGQYILVTSKFISSDGKLYRRTNQQMTPLFKGDICMVMSDVPNGRALAKCFLVDEDNKYTLNQRIGSFTADDRFDKKYFYYLMNRNKYFLSFNDGNGQTNLRKDDILKFSFYYIPIEDQYSIVQKLDKIKGIIEKRQQELQILDELIKARFVEMFGSIKKNNKNWETYRLRNIAEVRGRVGWKGYKKEDLREFGPLVLGATHLTDNGSLDLSEPVYLSYEKFKESPEIVLHMNDLIFTQRGNTIGKVGLVTNEIGEATINPCVLILRPIDINPIYFQTYFLMDETKNDMWALNSGSAQPMITQKGIGDYIIMLPPLELQNEFAEFVQEVDKSKVVVQKALDEAQLLFDSLMQQYFG